MKGARTHAAVAADLNVVNVHGLDLMLASGAIATEGPMCNYWDRQIFSENTLPDIFRKHPVLDRDYSNEGSMCNYWDRDPNILAPALASSLLSAPPAAVVLPTSPPGSHTTLPSPTTWHQRFSHSSESCSKTDAFWACSTGRALFVDCLPEIGRAPRLRRDVFGSLQEDKYAASTDMFCYYTARTPRYVLGSNPSGEQSGPR
jgi:hypothetical protein